MYILARSTCGLDFLSRYFFLLDEANKIERVVYVGLTHILYLRSASQETSQMEDILAEECDMLLLCRRESRSTSTKKYLDHRISRYQTTAST